MHNMHPVNIAYLHIKFETQIRKKILIIVQVMMISVM